MHIRVHRKQQVTRIGEKRMYIVREYAPDEPPSVNEEVLYILYALGPLDFDDLVSGVRKRRSSYNLTVTRDQVRQVLSYLKRLGIVRLDKLRGPRSRCWTLVLPSPFIDYRLLAPPPK